MVNLRQLFPKGPSRAVSVLMGLLIAALMRLVWRRLTGLPVFDPLGLTAICVAAVALLYLIFARAKARH